MPPVDCLTRSRGDAARPHPARSAAGTKGFPDRRCTGVGTGLPRREAWQTRGPMQTVVRWARLPRACPKGRSPFEAGGQDAGSERAFEAPSAVSAAAGPGCFTVFE